MLGMLSALKSRCDERSHSWQHASRKQQRSEMSSKLVSHELDVDKCEAQLQDEAH